MTLIYPGPRLLIEKKKSVNPNNDTRAKSIISPINPSPVAKSANSAPFAPPFLSQTSPWPSPPSAQLHELAAQIHPRPGTRDHTFQLVFKIRITRPGLNPAAASLTLGSSHLIRISSIAVLPTFCGGSHRKLGA